MAAPRYVRTYVYASHNMLINATICEFMISYAKSYFSSYIEKYFMLGCACSFIEATNTVNAEIFIGD